MKTNITNIKKIIAKVRSMYKYNSEYVELLSLKADVSLDENENGDLELSFIRFRYYGSIYIYSDRIIHTTEEGRKTLLITYNGWDALLSL